MIVLKIGDKGEKVKDLQTKLVQLGYRLPIYGIDSHYGNETSRAVMDSQLDMGLVPTGIVDENTWNILNDKINQLLSHPKDEELKVKKLKYENHINVLKIPLKCIETIKVMMAEQPAQTIYQFVDTLKKKNIKLPNFIINGGYFTMSTGKTETCTISDGVKMNDGYGYGFDFGLRVLYDGTIDFGTAAYPDRTNICEYIGGSPAILINGEEIYDKSIGKIYPDGRQPRTTVGINNNDFYMATFDGRQTNMKGATFQELIKFHKDTLKCKHAIALDGGGSTVMAEIVNGKTSLINSPSEIRSVDSFVCVYLKEGIQVKQVLDVSGFPTLYKGSPHTYYVKLVQKRLIELGYDLGIWGADGDFGSKTFEAVIKFQKDRSLLVDGIVGQQTYKALFG